LLPGPPHLRRSANRENFGWPCNQADHRRIFPGAAFQPLLGLQRPLQTLFRGDAHEMTSKSGAAIAAAAATLFWRRHHVDTTYAAAKASVSAPTPARAKAPQGRQSPCKCRTACKGQGFSAMTRTSATPPREVRARLIRLPAGMRPGVCRPHFHDNFSEASPCWRCLAPGDA